MDSQREQHLPSILVVDDDDLLRGTLARSLARRGFPVKEASSVQEALLVTDTFFPEWVVLDLRMPDELGLSLIEPLVKRFPGVRILVVTGYASISTAVSAMRLGAHNYISKPANVYTILDAFQSEMFELGSPSEDVKTLADFEWEHIQKTLEDCSGNISQAAKKLGIHRRSLQRKLNRGDSGHQ